MPAKGREIALRERLPPVLPLLLPGKPNLKKKKKIKAQRDDVKLSTTEL